MDVEKIRSICLALPHATEDIQWDNDLLFRIGGKMFTVFGLDSGRLSFKCTPDEFEELILKDGIVPAPYVARYKWVSITRDNALRNSEIERLIRQSYDLVYNKLPAKTRKEFEKKQVQS